MVKLLPMQHADFQVYLENGIREYAAEHVRNGDWHPEQAEQLSRDEHMKLLPDGVASKDQFVWSIVGETGEKLGVLWAHVNMDSPRRRAFIYDFMLEPKFRGKGLGKQALQALDARLREMKVESVALHVFAHNTNAFELYKKAGYETTDMHMRKVYGED